MTLPLQDITTHVTPSAKMALSFRLLEMRFLVEMDL